MPEMKLSRINLRNADELYRKRKKMIIVRGKRHIAQERYTCTNSPHTHASTHTHILVVKRIKDTCMHCPQTLLNSQVAVSRRIYPAAQTGDTDDP